MKTKLLSLAVLVTALLLSANSFAQTAGTMTFTFTQGSPIDPSMNGGCVMAVWIQSGSTFVKTNLRYLGTGTKDHLPTYGAKAGWTTLNNAMTANVVNAVTGATREDGSVNPATTPGPLDSYSVTWDGTNVAGTVVADGIYTVWYEVTWDDNKNLSDFVNTGFAFTKGPAITSVNPANTPPLTAMRIVWTPTALSLDSVYKTKIAIYPNPSNGVINVNYNDIPVSKIEVVNVLGQVVKSIKLDTSSSKTAESIDLSGNANGLYIINVSTNETSSSYKVILDK
ncbi:MAG TPA: T9SS type A sorting domain-containing protein [Flavobacterium sp.]|nr:T9SS type A sorting domain-containing protein [Flavobacterium sp.]